MKRADAGSWERLAERLNLFAVHTALYHWLGGRWVGRDVLLLSTIGRRSGQRRCTALFYIRDGADYLIVASNGGEERLPGWWHNLRSNPQVSIQVGRRHMACRAEAVAARDRDALWPRFDAVYGGYRGYRQRTRRPLPIIRLRPTSASDRPSPLSAARPAGV